MRNFQDSWDEYVSLLQFQWKNYIKSEYEKNPKEVKQKIYYVCKFYPEIDTALQLKRKFELHAYEVEYRASEKGARLREWEEKVFKKCKDRQKHLTD